MKILLLLLISINLYAINPGDYSTFNKYINALDKSNANWINNNTDVENVVSKHFINSEQLSAKSTNLKVKAISKKIDTAEYDLPIKIMASYNSSSVSIFRNDKNTIATSGPFSWTCKRAGNYVITTTMGIWDSGASHAPRLLKNGSVIKTGSSSGSGGTISNYSFSCNINDVFTLTPNGGGIIRGTVTIEEVL